MSEVNRTEAPDALLQQQDGHDGALKEVATQGRKMKGKSKKTNERRGRGGG